MLSLIERDRQVIWHPYTQVGLNPDLLEVESASGATLRLQGGQEILDGISSWWVTLHGHAHPLISQAIYSQAQRLEHVIFAGATHEPAVLLAEKLTRYPAFSACGLKRVFYSDNGSTAVETALKMAYQYAINSGQPRAPYYLALRGGYHGDTLLAMSVSGRSSVHQNFDPLLLRAEFLESGDYQHLERVLKQTPSLRPAAFIFEPRVQGVAGMVMDRTDFLAEAVAQCQDAGVLCVADEVFTGFGRTGRRFAIEARDDLRAIQPDFICLAKGLTGGALPLAVTLTTEAVYSAFDSPRMEAAFLHGHSYTANPLGCAAALASWEILEQHTTQMQITRIEQQTATHIESLRHHPQIRAARALGTIGAVDLNLEGSYFTKRLAALRKISLELGVLLRPLGKTLYVLPPYCCTSEEMDRLYAGLAEMASRSAWLVDS